LKTGLAENAQGRRQHGRHQRGAGVIAEKAGARAVMRGAGSGQIRAEGGVARMASPRKIREIMAAVSIPVDGQVRIGHFAEAQITSRTGRDYIDEYEVLTPATKAHHVDKARLQGPVRVRRAQSGEALRRIAEGAAMIRTKGEAGTGECPRREAHAARLCWR